MNGRSNVTSGERESPREIRNEEVPATNREREMIERLPRQPALDILKPSGQVGLECNEH